ncbi:MAG: hypothetical protein PHH63_03705 [Bacteroidales bacterium]|jgi:hypothetical protein|nr:hypothetical protein [Bacteroidales bacterium]
MENKGQLQSSIEIAIRKAADKYKSEFPESALTDLFIQANQDKAELSVYDDENHLLYSTQIQAWANDEEEGEDEEIFNQEAEQVVGAAVRKCESNGLFKEINILEPFSVILVDNQFDTISELFTIDSDQLVIGDDLMKDWEKDLDNFMEQIAREFK